MPKPTAEQIRDRAREAAVESAPHAAVGDFIGFIDEAEDVITMKFAARQKGYVGWNWHVTLFVSEDDMTVSEVNLIPGENSLLAPDWVPWADRLADWKALQAELEAQAAAEAAEAAEDGTEDDDSAEDDDAADSDEVEGVELGSESDDFELQAEAPASSEVEDLAVALEEQGDETEPDTDDAGKRPPRFLRRRLGRLKKKK